MDKVVWTNALGSNIGDCIYFAEFSKVIILRNTNRSVSIAMKIYIFVNSRLWLTFPIFIVVWPSSVCSLPPFLALHRSLRGEYCGGCRRSNSTEQPHAFQVILTERPPLVLSADNEGDMSDWMLVLCQSVSKGVRRYTRCTLTQMHFDSHTPCTHTLTYHLHTSQHMFKTHLMAAWLCSQPWAKICDHAWLYKQILPCYWHEEQNTLVVFKTFVCMNMSFLLSHLLEYSFSRLNRRFPAEKGSFHDFQIISILFISSS